MQISTPQSYLRFPLTRLLATASSVRVLRLLMTQPGWHGASAVARETGLTPQGVRPVLAELCALGIVVAAGPPQVFSGYRGHPLAGALRNLFVYEEAQAESVLHALGLMFAAQPQVEAAWVFGDVAAGVDQPGTALDIGILVGTNQAQATTAGVQECLEAFEKEDGVLVRLTSFTRAELVEARSWCLSVAPTAVALKGLAPGLLLSQCEEELAAEAAVRASTSI